LRVHAVQFRGVQDRVYRGGTLAAGMTAREEPIASAKGYAADCVFGDVVIGFEPRASVAKRVSAVRRLMM